MHADRLLKIRMSDFMSLRVAGQVAEITTVNLAVVLLGLCHCWCTCCELTEIDPVRYRRHEIAPCCVHFMIAVGLSIFIDVI